MLHEDVRHLVERTTPRSSQSPLPRSPASLLPPRAAGASPSQSSLQLPPPPRKAAMLRARRSRGPPTPPPPPKYLVMIHRRPPDSRAFDNTTSALLLNALSRVCPDGVELRVYYGFESPLATIQLFSNAIGVVGFHGAGFANAYFAMSRCCVVEITTTAFMPGGASRAHGASSRGGGAADDDDGERTLGLWRSNRLISDANTHLDWRVMNISHALVAERAAYITNRHRREGSSTTAMKTRHELLHTWAMSQRVPFVHLSEEEAREAAGLLEGCLRGQRRRT